jgi:hypothetical protein
MRPLKIFKDKKVEIISKTLKFSSSDGESVIQGNTTITGYMHSICAEYYYLTHSLGGDVSIAVPRKDAGLITLASDAFETDNYGDGVYS